MSSSSSSTVPPELDNLSNDQLRIFREAFNVIDPSGEGFIMRTGKKIHVGSLTNKLYGNIQSTALLNLLIENPLPLLFLLQQKTSLVVLYIISFPLH